MNNLFLKRMENILGDDYNLFIESLKQDNVKAIYLNDLKDNVLNHLNNKYIKKHPLVNNGYYFDYNKYPLGKSPYFLCGLYYIQEPSAMLVSSLLDVREDDYILDMCGAPGGKSCNIATKLSNKGLLISNDINPLRSKILSENIERFSITNTIVTNSDPILFTKELQGYFDKVILDAPCSGEGMFRKDNKAIQDWSIDKVHKCAKIQKQLIDQAYMLLKEDGILVYSTCTYSKEENEDNILYAINKYNFKLLNINHTNGIKEGINLKEVARLYPYSYHGEGQFIAILQKQDKTPTIKIKNQKSNISKEKYKLIEKFYKENLNIEVPPILIDNNNHIYSINYNFPKLNNIRILRNGLYLGQIKKNRFEPSYSLALTLTKKDVKRSYTFKEDSEEIKKYINGETLVGNNKKGYGVIFIDEYPLSFYKESNNQIKNLFPKGLRRWID